VELLLYGTNHTRLSAEQRESLSFLEDEIPATLKSLAADPSVREVCAISTCNRVEFYVAANDAACLPRIVRQHYQDTRDIDIRAISDAFYYYRNEDAVRHLFRVITSLDSMVIGEADIVHQVKKMYQLATDAGTNGLLTDRAFHQAFMVAKKARSDTNIGVGSTSVAMVAVEYVERHRAGLTDSAPLVVGAGQMSMKMAQYLKKHGAPSITMANRSVEKAAKKVRDLNGRAVPLSQLTSAIREADIVMIGIDYDRQLLLDQENLTRISEEREHRPLIIVDISTPKVVADVDGSIPGIHVFDLDDFQPILDQNERRRQEAIRDVERIIDVVVERFATWRHEAQILPDIIQLRKKVKAMANEEIERHAKELPEEMLPTLRSFAKALSERIINAPIQTLRSWMYESESPDTSEALNEFRALFDLDVVDNADDHAEDDRSTGSQNAPLNTAPNCELCAPHGCVSVPVSGAENVS
jgi:glutamyl-tRNA reductase